MSFYVYVYHEPPIYKGLGRPERLGSGIPLDTQVKQIIIKSTRFVYFRVVIGSSGRYDTPSPTPTPTLGSLFPGLWRWWCRTRKDGEVEKRT